MKYSISPGELVDKLQDLSEQLESIQELSGEMPDFLEEFEAGEVDVTRTAVVVEELLHAVVMASLALRLIRAGVRNS